MEHNKDPSPVVSPVASPPLDTVQTAPEITSVAPAPEILAPSSMTAQPADELAVVSTEPPRYERHEGAGKEVVPAPEPAIISHNSTSLQTEKTIWQPSTSGPGVPPGQGAVIERVANLKTLGEEPRLIICPFCSQEGMTRVQKESTGATGMAAICCCLFGGLCCAFIPFCMEMCHDAHHFCTKCGQKVAIRPHEGAVQTFAPLNPVVTAPGQIQPPKAAAVSHETSGIGEKN